MTDTTGVEWTERTQELSDRVGGVMGILGTPAKDLLLKVGNVRVAVTTLWISFLLLVLALVAAVWLTSVQPILEAELAAAESRAAMWAARAEQAELYVEIMQGTAQPALLGSRR